MVERLSGIRMVENYATCRSNISDESQFDVRTPPVSAPLSVVDGQPIPRVALLAESLGLQ